MRGVLFFAHNNELIDYGTMALCAATLVKRNMPGVDVALATDENTLKGIRAIHPAALMRKLIDHVVVVDSEATASNQRRYLSMDGRIEKASYKNRNRLTAYEISPFDETLVLDTDYLVLDSSLLHVWKQGCDFLMNRHAVSMETNREIPAYKRLDPMSIRMYWATVMFFRKTAEAKLLFDIVATVRQNYDYYAKLYRFDTIRYRNDFTFSVAAHLMNGEVDAKTFVGDLPNEAIMTCFEPGGLLEVRSPHRMIFKVKAKDVDIPVSMGSSVHCMNKATILKNAKAILEFANG